MTDKEKTLFERWAAMDDDVYYGLQHIRQRIAELEESESLESREARAATARPTQRGVNP